MSQLAMLSDDLGEDGQNPAAFRREVSHLGPLNEALARTLAQKQS